MLDIKFVRNNPDVVKQNIKNKFQDRKLPLVDEVIELDKENREGHSVFLLTGAEKSIQQIPNTTSGLSGFLFSSISTVLLIKRR